MRESIILQFTNKSRLISGPKVEVYVGAQRKHYSLPKLLLCHYSTYFDRCFNGRFIEAQSQKLDLPEDKVDDFEVLLEFMLRGTLAGSLQVQETGGQAIRRCIEFLEYADKYDLGAATCEAVYEPLKKALLDPYKGKVTKAPRTVIKPVVIPRPGVIIPDDIRTVYRIAGPESPLRTLVTQGALSAYGVKECVVHYKNPIAEIPGFAADLLAQICTSLKPRQKWIDPITRLERFT